MATLSTSFSPSSQTPAIIIPMGTGGAGTEISYAQLQQHISSFQRRLASIGISAHSAVSVALPNTLEFIVSFLAVAAQRAIAAPLNPAYKQAEFEFFIDDIKSKLIIVPRGAVEADAPAVRAARKFGAGVAEIWWDGAKGEVVMDLKVWGGLGGAVQLETAQEEDVALVLHTSGTTGRPKAVPLTHKNLTRTMENITRTYQLTPSDRTYLVMPLFHVHGLLAGFLAPLASGGTVIVPPKFSASTFWIDFRTHKANWYTAVPTIHQILLKSPLPTPIPEIRFIRSCSSPLSPTTFHALEEALKAPVLEAYAMTEAAHQMTSNPLPPAKRKPGTVGVGQGVDVAILDDAGNELPQGKEGEICIRGVNVTKGYINNPSANASSFTKSGYFRTGDQGKMDEDGYVIITGRIKELINRGGEKISPIEVDNAISAHPKVSEAVSFAIESEMYGQEVAAAVVLKPGQNASAAELKTFVSEKLSKFKIPTQWFFTEHMPKTATGKIQRRIVAEEMAKLPKAKL
ncbi:hypothetical protein BZA05DRAFT_387487 [Tricharina praecox]|uniref:uncharacterized protein n=1 Tax=Tricharina praecox TaxID=43433 RepID=UPI00221EE98F|nr:uncharacterized protein BZA05DRAFT_387487 [Tricharina praecox]KAI5857180.1 hypothetical protein BZA05DRAFT_387487 [Tricharina praecox]